MKLDPSIKSLSDILTPFDTERAKDFIGQKGFFANSIDCFRAGEPYCAYGTLTRVFDDQDAPYLGGHATCYWFFIPESSLKQGSSLKPIEKKYRPYTLEEFCDKFPIGRPIKYRNRDMEDCERYLILNGYWNNRQLKDEIRVYIGPFPFSFDDLFDALEWQDPDTGEWKPFGVEVEE